MNTIINVRVDKKTKAEAKKTLEAIGLDLSSGIKLFLKRVVAEQGIPFVPRTIGGLTRAQMDKELEYALKHGKRYATSKEMMDDILK